MKKLISAKLAGKIIILILLLLTVYHVLILINILPSEIVWGGQIEESSSRIFYLELISLIVTLLFILIVAAKIDYINPCKFKKVVNITVWIMFIYFIFNFFGNIASDVSVENFIFAPITVFLAILSFRLAIEK